MEHPELVPHLFRTEFSKITAVLCKHMGIEHLQLAEDIAGETFLSALETWAYRGVPANPVAWLYTVAKNKAINHFQRHRTFQEKVVPGLRHAEACTAPADIDLSPRNIADSQLQLLFAICHPAIPPEAQIGLALRALCGFGIDEIAHAFLTNKAVINKRLFRAREKLREEKTAMEMPSAAAIPLRLSTVLKTLYLLYNEGYYSESREDVLQEDLCQEAMRLTYLLLEHEQTRLPEVNALLSLMCFHASRFPARKNPQGALVLYQDQDESLWDQRLITRGVYYLHQSSTGSTLSAYHLEAFIAYWHTIKTDSREKWENILQLYDQLLALQYSPVAALNRAFALYKTAGSAAAILAAEALALHGNPYYHTLLGELYKDIDPPKAISHLQEAYTLAGTRTDREIIQRKISVLTGW